MKRGLAAVAAAMALGVTAWVAPAAAGTAPYCGITWGSLPKEASARGRRHVTNVRAGQHACFDRLVLDVRGGRARHVLGELRGPGADGRLRLRGAAARRREAVEITAAVPAYDGAGRPTYRPANRAELVSVAGYPTFRQVAWAGSFEGMTTVGLGVRARLPYRVFTLAGPGTGSRLVIDVAHRW